MNKIILKGKINSEIKKYDTQTKAGASLLIAKCILSVPRPLCKGKYDNIEVTFFDKNAQIAVDNLFKGNEVLVEGMLQTSSWQKNGQTVYDKSVIVSQIYFCDNSGVKDGVSEDDLDIMMSDGSEYSDDLPF